MPHFVNIKKEDNDTSARIKHRALLCCMSSVDGDRMQRQKRCCAEPYHYPQRKGNITLQKYILSVFIMSMSISVGRRSTVLVPLSLSRGTSNDTHDNPN